MSTATPNFFAVLGDDSGPAVGTGAVHLDQPPKVAAPTTSKKADVNPKADPSKARKRSPGAPSNDRTLKENKDGGRASNRRVPVKEGANAHHSRRSERTDRMPRSSKRDTPKRTRAGWGDEGQEPQEEAAGEEIAHEQESADATEDAEAANAETQAPKLSLEEYLQQQREIADSLITRSKKTNAAAPAEPKRPEPTSTTPEPRKKLSNKPRKEVQTLEIDSTQAPPLVGDREDRRPSTRGGAPRGGAPRGGAPRGGRAPRGGKSSGKPSGKPAAGKASGKSSNGPASFDLGSLPKLN